MTYPSGATPLDPDETAGLIPNYITTQGELNALEKGNILDALNWANRRAAKDILNASFVLELHRRMFEKVWKWAGKIRRTEKNIGVDPAQIQNQLAALLGDTKHWIESGTFSWNEIAARFHHRLVQIHAFANGNGRHARLMTDLLLASHGQPGFTWGITQDDNQLVTEGPVRDRYIHALQSADKGDIEPLISFATSGGT
jgi:Fic-DOC domain mobile mystery protein B